MKGLSRDTRELLKRGRGETLEPAHRARLKKAVLAEVVGVSVGTAALTASWTATAAKVVGVLTLVGAATAMVAVGSGTRHALRSSQPSSAVDTQVRARSPAGSSTLAASVLPPEPPAPTPAVAPGVAAANAPAPAPAPTPAPAPVARRSVPVTSPPAPESASSEPRVQPISSLTEEVSLLREARAALDAREPGRALDLLEDHARRFPNGVLAPERAYTHIVALCAAGQVDRARAESASFLASQPEGPLSLRVRATCGTENRP